MSGDRIARMVEQRRAERVALLREIERRRGEGRGVKRLERRLGLVTGDLLAGLAERDR